MQIDVGDKYQIKTDRYNWIFRERAGIDKRNGKQRWNEWGYWGTLEQMARCLPDHFMRRQEELTPEAMVTYHSAISALHRAIAEAQEGLLKQVKPFDEIVERGQ